jgi:hypothetical protein
MSDAEKVVMAINLLGLVVGLAAWGINHQLGQIAYAIRERAAEPKPEEEAK